MKSSAWTRPPSGTTSPTISNPTFTGQSLFANGSVGAPSISWINSPTTGFYRVSADLIGQVVAGALTSCWSGATYSLTSSGGFRFSSGSDPTSGVDTAMCRGGSNAMMFTGGSTATTTARTELNKATASISNAVATTVVTFTVPNAAHSASALVRVTGSIGAGGAIGANEATATNCYIVTLTRTAGVNLVAAISSAFGAAASNVAGGTTVTCTAALAAVSGAVGATNTVDVQVTISRGGGSSTNHTCVTHVSLLNANATGITVA